MTANGPVSEKTPLSVLLFHAAMARHQSISTFADSIHVGAISLRQFMLNKTQRPRTRTIELIGEALNMPVEEVRRRMDLAPETMPPFGDWLQNQMKGRFSRAKLSKETRISDGALRNYLQNDTLPDSDQAQRLAEALAVSPLEMARVVVANQVIHNGGATAPAEEDAAASVDAGPALALADTAAEEAPAPAAPAAAAGRLQDEDRLLSVWRRLHPQGRRAAMVYMADLLAEG